MTPCATIIGCGMRSPLGLDRAASAAAVRAGISVQAEHPFMIDRFGHSMVVTRDLEIDPAMMGSERLASLAIPAAREALAPIHGRGARLGVLVSLGEERPGQDETISGRVIEALADGIAGGGEIKRVRHWMGGHAGGLVAIASALDLIMQEKVDFVLAGGVDSYLAPETLEWLDEIEQLHSENNIYGFCPGEAAGFVLIGPAMACGDPGLIDIVGAGSSVEDNLIKTDDICIGEGLARAIKAAAADLPEGTKLDRILCDMNGERYRGNEYGFSVLRTSDLHRDAADFEAPADCWGDLGAATGPLLAGLAIEAHARDYAPGPLSLLWASSEAGRRAAVVLAQREER